MQRISAILLLLVYVNAALGISFDSCACNGKQVKVILLRLQTVCSICGGDKTSMECCKSETYFGYTDQHKLPVAEELSITPSSPGKIDRFIFDIQVEEFETAVAVQLSRYGPKRSLSSRSILSLVQSLRI